jgi:hypothetical protein
VYVYRLLSSIIFSDVSVSRVCEAIVVFFRFIIVVCSLCSVRLFHVVG